ncbi:6265_t:CDS:10 [Diversispora eburnea]|uniref:6265_t:CDS:1 n=1 Tax=Diversispora eburnea TaxID=1213867 RepID=A0A9N9AT81_9GLOM|nr:6265_t:CDS:10 [Diversispora eburnea]
MCGNETISKAALRHDIRLIMVGFQNNKNYDFTTFTEVWSHYNFSLIHFACPERLVKLGVLYGIYLLYFTQPDNFEKIRIRVSLKIFRSLARLHKYCQENDMFDAEYVHERLIAENAFEFVAVMDPCGEYGRDVHSKKKSISNTVAEIKDEMMMTPINENPDSLKNLEKISNLYYTQKRKIVDTEDAKIASRKITRKKMRSDPIPEDSSLIDIWSIVAPLSASDENIAITLRNRLPTTSFQVRNKIRSQPYNNSNRQYVPLAMQAAMVAERDAARQNKARHRSTSCNHHDRQLFLIKKKGRPITQCAHCRELRKTRKVHVKCNCHEKQTTGGGGRGTSTRQLETDDYQPTTGDKTSVEKNVFVVVHSNISSSYPYSTPISQSSINSSNPLNPPLNPSLSPSNNISYYSHSNTHPNAHSNFHPNTHSSIHPNTYSNMVEGEEGEDEISIDQSEVLGKQLCHASSNDLAKMIYQPCCSSSTYSYSYSSYNKPEEHTTAFDEDGVLICGCGCNKPDADCSSCTDKYVFGGSTL